MNAATAPLRVLILTETYRPEIGGGERQAAVLGAGLKRRGHQVMLLTRHSRPGLADEETIDGMPVVRVGPIGPGRRRKWGLLFTVLPALLRLRGRYDVVLVSGFRLLAVPALLASRRTGAPVVLKADSVGEFSGEFFRAGLAGTGLTPSSAPVRAALWLRNRLLRRAAAFVAISDEISDELAAHGVAPQQVHRIPNGVDTQLFRPVTHQQRASLRNRLGLPSGPVVVYTGRLVSYKGLPLLVEAWRQLVPEYPGAVLVLVGEGGGDMHDCEPALRAFVAQHGLESRVRFTGPVSNVHEWLQAADVFVFPTENEAFGLSLVEAMACGLPAVTTRVGGLRDFVEHGVNAWAIEPGDAAALTAGLRALLTDAALAARLGAAARETVLARFGEDAVAHAYEQLLDAAWRGSRQEVAA
jgi:glycosyltransferase involved in cell wall biosynthesis